MTIFFLMVTETSRSLILEFQEWSNLWKRRWQNNVELQPILLPKYFETKVIMDFKLMFGVQELCFMPCYMGPYLLRRIRWMIYTDLFWRRNFSLKTQYLSKHEIWLKECWIEILMKESQFMKSSLILGCKILMKISNSSTSRKLNK